MYGNNLRPAAQPITAPVNEARNAYITYLSAIVAFPYPSALYVPISPLSSSTIRVIVVRHTRPATIMKNNGKTVAIAFILFALDS